MSFETLNGPIGKGFIHVHHLELLSNSEGKRDVDPESDLIPVCPNCHAMIHRQTTLFSERHAYPSRNTDGIESPNTAVKSNMKVEGKPGS